MEIQDCGHVVHRKAGQLSDNSQVVRGVLRLEIPHGVFEAMEIESEAVCGQESWDHLAALDDQFGFCAQEEGAEFEQGCGGRADRG